MSKEITLINAGLYRTGTTTYRAVFDDLDEYKYSYHMFEVTLNKIVPFRRQDKNIDDYLLWNEIFTIIKNNKNKSVEERAMLIKEPVEKLLHTPFYTMNEKTGELEKKYYQCSHDAPGCFIWEELSILYPNAKLMLSIRDNPKSWLNSVYNSVFYLHPRARQFGISVLIFLNYGYRGSFYNNVYRHFLVDPFNGAYEDELIDYYNTFNQEVIDICKKKNKKLLIHNVKDGYSKEFCEFFDLDYNEYGDKKFPRFNNNEAMKARVKAMDRFGKQIFFGSLFVTGIIGFGAFKFLLKK